MDRKDWLKFIKKTVIDRWEGGYQNSKIDGGNWTTGKAGKGKQLGTKFGITPKTYAAYKGISPTKLTTKDMKNITKDEAAKIYLQDYVLAPKFDKLPDHIAKNVVDFGINAGPKRAAKKLQELIFPDKPEEVDGIIGNKTLNRLNDVHVTSSDYSDKRDEHYNKQSSKLKKKYLKGWLRRSDGFREEDRKREEDRLKTLMDFKYKQETGLPIEQTPVEEAPVTTPPLAETAPEQDFGPVHEWVMKNRKARDLQAKLDQTTPTMQDGGTVNDIVKTREDGYEDGGVPMDYESMMADLDKRQAAFKEEKADARKRDSYVDMMNALAQFGATSAAAQAGKGAGAYIQAPKLGLTGLGAEDALGEGPQVEDYAKNLQMLKMFRELKAKKGLTPSEKLAQEKFEYQKEQDKLKQPKVSTTKIKTVNEEGQPVTQLVNQSTGDVIKEYATPKKEMSQYQKESLVLWKEGNELKKKMSEKNRQMREDKEDRIKKARDRDFKLKFGKAVNQIKKDFTTHPVMKEVFKQKLSFTQVDGLLNEIEKGNTVATSALGTKMARAMGEVGVLTDADVIRYIQSAKLSQKVQDRVNLYFKGKLSKPTKEDLKAITAIMRIGAQKQIRPIMNDFINQGVNIGLSPEEAKTRLFGTELGKTEYLGNTVMVKRKSDGKTIRMDKAKAEKYLKDPRFEEVK